MVGGQARASILSRPKFRARLSSRSRVRICGTQAGKGVARFAPSRPVATLGNQGAAVPWGVSGAAGESASIVPSGTERNRLSWQARAGR